MRSSRSAKYRIQLTIIIVVVSLFVLFLYTQREEDNVDEEDIEKHTFSPKKRVPVEYTPINETVPLESTNCAYKV